MNRIVIFLALPVGVLLFVLTFTVLQSLVRGTGLCATWLGIVLPATYCR